MIAVLTGQVQAILMKQSGTTENKTGPLPGVWSQWSTCSYKNDPQSQVCVGFRSRSIGSFFSIHDDYFNFHRSWYWARKLPRTLLGMDFLDLRWRWPYGTNGLIFCNSLCNGLFRYRTNSFEPGILTRSSMTLKSAPHNYRLEKIKFNPLCLLSLMLAPTQGYFLKKQVVNHQK